MIEYNIHCNVLNVPHTARYWTQRTKHINGDMLDGLRAIVAEYGIYNIRSITAKTNGVVIGTFNTHDLIGMLDLCLPAELLEKLPR